MKLTINFNDKNKELNTIKYWLDVFKGKIETQISTHQEEMNKKNSQFDFYEGRKIEAEIILEWLKDIKLEKRENNQNGN